MNSRPKSGHHLIEQAGSAAVEIVAADDVVAGLQHADDGVDRSHAAGEDSGGDSAFERGEIFLKPGARGIRHARVLVSFVLADALLDVSGGRIDRNRDRAGEWIGFLSGVDGAGGKTELFCYSS